VSGTLYVVATPIGHLGDVSQRAKETLSSVDFVACEDTRVTGRLLVHLGLKKPMVRCDDHTEKRVAATICSRVREGEDCALVSDAGTPLISDPGYAVIRAAIELDLSVVPIPGPSAVTAALSVSGLPTFAYRFCGYLPVKKGPRRRRLETLAEDDATQIFFLPPHKLATWLKDIRECMGDRKACLARELTKKFEEVVRGPLSELEASYTSRTPRGEMVLLVEGKAD
jgi:16S rRNA (cytidine1402-2'-O)-methyltransferase